MHSASAVEQVCIVPRDVCCTLNCLWEDQVPLLRRLVLGLDIVFL